MSIPSPTPSKGAMLAANAILSTADLFPKTAINESPVKWFLRVRPMLAEVIDKETHTKDLAASLRKMMSWAWQYAEVSDIDLAKGNGPLSQDYREAQSLLAKLIETK